MPSTNDSHHVVPNPAGGWDVKRSHADRASGHYETKQQAVDFMLDNTALSAANIDAEVNRYISWPGQALAYKTGELKIRELRAWAEEQMGDAFDLRVFHDTVLANGSLPLDVLEDYVKTAYTRPNGG